MSKKDLKQKFMSKKNKQRIKNNEGQSLQLRWKLEQVALKVKVRVIEGISEQQQNLLETLWPNVLILLQKH